jgi:hypothetical protein
MPFSRKTTSLVVALAIVTAAASAIALQAQQADAQYQNTSIARIQKTAMSEPAPVTAPGHATHQVVFPLPLRDDGKIWSGTVTFTASKPIEIEVMHRYNPAAASDEAHGQPPVAVINGTTITYSHLTGIVDSTIISGDSPISSGTFDFAGSALVFHKRSGEPFTVTYTIDAAARTLTH